MSLATPKVVFRSCRRRHTEHRVSFPPTCESGLGLSNSVVAIANAGKGNLYLALSGGAVLQWQPGTANFYQVVGLSYVATGMATDLLRRRLYIADGTDNTIYVYSTANGTLLKTIQ
jgi:hypothetical protein